MENYNWWDDPKNQEEVKRLSWWEHEENKTFFQLPISVSKSGEYWVATCNEETKKFLGDLTGCAQGKTKEIAIRKMFGIIKMTYDFTEAQRRDYQRWVPFRKGDWGHTGGTWFVVFGIHVYIRYGKGMKYGWYVPFTKLNISFSSEWAAYRRWKQELNRS